MKIQPLLEEYLLENGSLPLTGIGWLSIEKKAAAVSTTEPVIEPPQTEIIFSTVKPADQDIQALTEFIGQRLSVSNQQATQLLSSGHSITHLVEDSGSFELLSFGLLQNENGVITFKQVENLSTYLPPIPISKRLHQTEIQPVNDELVLQPDEPEEIVMPAEPMEESVEPVATQNDYWWVWAIIIFVVSVLLILFRYIQ